MIGFIQGKILYYKENLILVNVNGVGYRIFVPKHITSTITAPGQELTLHTYTHIREDILSLYGFKEVSDLNLFEMLLTVSGIGPKTALGVFDKGERNQLIQAIIDADTTFFEGIPRLGKKNAQKIIIELKSKIGSTKDLDLTGEAGMDAKELIDALKGFGFTTKEASDALKNIDDKNAPMQIKVKQALKYLGK